MSSLAAQHDRSAGNQSADPARQGDDSSPSGAERIVVSIATYNERDNLLPLLDRIHAVVPAADVLVIDDNSPDGTGKLADQRAQADRRIHVLHRPGKLGLGTALMAALRWGIEHGYDYLVNLDADFSHPPRYIPALLAGMRHADVMIGSRYVPGGGIEGWGLQRRLMSLGINCYARLFLRLRVRDTSGAFRCYRLAKVKQIDLQEVRSRGYSFQEEFLYHCRRAGCRLAETPIVFEDRRIGQSKINNAEALGALWIILQLGWRELFAGTRPR